MKKYLVLSLLICWQCYIYSQNCFNAGFETGTLEGYYTFMGEILEDGTVTIPYPGPGQNRHTIVHRDEDPDPIAAEFCDIYSTIPPVPDGGGQFAMRLGNSSAGAQAERVLMEFTVTEELTFFLLHYAVILNDPDHEHFEQPRFELRIRDENGTPFPCGEYLVRAAENIPGFETCEEGWRVRPWTAAGFELQSYLGQTIQIEIMTTDCSQGAHAGYAYVDASCQPLQISIDGYCPDSEVVHISVPEGFSSYNWSTGDTTNVIEVTNPTPGTNYSVTVTSATGCDLVLEDELPALEDLPQPDFDPHPDEVICTGESIWLSPTGENLEEIFSLDFGYAADSFLVSPTIPTTYTFVAADLYGCESDTLQIFVDVGGLPIDTAIVQPVSCNGLGSIELVITEIEVESIDWDNGQSGAVISELEPGTYEVTVTSTTGCEYSGMYNIIDAPELVVSQFDFLDLQCGSNTLATIEVLPEGGAPPYIYDWGNGPSPNPVLEQVGPGNYAVTVTDNGGCIAEGSIEVEAFPELVVTASQIEPSCIGGQTGVAQVDISGGNPNYQIQWDDPLSQTTELANGLAAGTYTILVTDANDCQVNTSVIISEVQVLELDFDQSDASCSGENDGSATVIVSGGGPSYNYAWDDPQNQTQATATNLLPGTYTVTITDQDGCMNVGQANLSDAPGMSIEITTENISCFGENDGRATVSVEGGTPNYSYHWLPPINGTTHEISHLAPGTYTVLVSDANGCEQTVEFSITEPASIEILPGEWTFPDCDNNWPATASVVVSGGHPPYRYLWETGDTSATVASYEAGFYQVRVSDQNDCEEVGEAEIQVFEFDLMNLGLTTDPERGTSYLCIGDEIELQLEANNELRSIHWNTTAQLDCYDCLVVNTHLLEATTFEVQVEDIYGCPGDAYTFIVVNPECGVYIPNVFSPNGDGINDLFYIASKSGELMIKSFLIFDRWGALVYSGCTDCPINDPNHGWDGQYKGKAASVGVYVYAIELAVPGQAAPILLKGDITLVR